MTDELSEIIKNDGENKSNVFKQFIEKKEIGKQILDEFLQKKYSNSSRGKGFFFSENERSKIGLISQLMGLETICCLKDFNVNVFENKDSVENRVSIINDTLLSIVNSLGLTQEKVENILSGDIENVSLVYDCSPFIRNDDIEDEELKVTNYVDSMAKVLETFISFRSFYLSLDKVANKISVEGFDSVEKIIEALVIKSIFDLNKAAIPLKEPLTYTIGEQEMLDVNGEKMLFKGWNYRVFNDAGCSPSLYFTYSVCSAYMALYGELKFVISAVREKEKTLTIEQRKRKVCPQVDFAKNPRLAEDYEFFKKIYKHFVDFNKRCVDAGHFVDVCLKNSKTDLTNDFIGFGFSKVSFDEILNSTTNDSLINSVFILLIFVYTGVDLDYQSVGKGEEINDLLIYSVQNVLKAYKAFEREHKSYIVDQCVLSFNEKMPASCAEQINLLRKQRIYVVSLMPLLIKAYGAISKYLINYPQKDMMNYLRITLNNRSFDKKANKKLWLWDKEGYNIVVNFLYILDLLDFYNYYEKFEFPYTNDEKSFTKRFDLLNEKHNNEIASLKSEYEANIQELNNKIELLTEEKNKMKPLEAEVLKIMTNYLEDHMLDIFGSMLNKARSENVKDSNSEIAVAFKRMVMSYFFDIVVDKMSVSDEEKEELLKIKDSGQFIKHEDLIYKRFRALARDFLSEELG